MTGLLRSPAKFITRTRKSCTADLVAEQSQMYRVHPQAGTELACRSITFTSMADQDNQTNRNLVFDIILAAYPHRMRPKIGKYRPPHLQTHVFL
jgi:hypothetical protein